ncbi:UrcA family protein [Qipengyuania vesicularis]|uniref:UrcA family protein n=1 Tax=Qipengyuania vesicularis TaxID=2867232 RepID=UPI001C870DC7|nr:UrcA family protein [Qipengyuania vesicularis]MBX7528217.1 UrcA family protein [Qipengyuania vesicularis]
MKKTLTTIALLALATPAVAAEDQSGFTIEYKDLNLGTEEGQKVLMERIDDAARTACEFNRSRTGSRLRSGDVKRCYKEAKKQAMAQFATLIEENAVGG